MRRLLLPFASLLVLAVLVVPAGADPITSPKIEGHATGTVDLTVSFDLNDAPGPLVTMDLYVVFAGLTPVTSSFALGSAFDGLTFGDGETDSFLTASPCDASGVSCADPPIDNTLDPASVFQAYVLLTWPSVAARSGGLFSLRFTPFSPSTLFSVYIVGDAGTAMRGCDPNDALCTQAVTMPFEIVNAAAPVDSGTARVQVDAVWTEPPPSPPTPVPEPTTLALLGAGLLGVAGRRIRRSR